MWEGLKCVPVGYLLAENPDSVVADIFVLSENLVKKNALGLMSLYMSFIGWFLACLPAFPVIVLLPYFNVSMSIFLRNCLEEDEKAPQTAERESVAV